MLAAAPLAGYIPLTALSAVLIVVAYRMGEWENFPELLRTTKSDFGIMLATFALTVIFDLTIAVGFGLAMAFVLFVRRMEEISQIKLVTPDSDLDVGAGSIRDKQIPPGVVVYRIEGPFFFGAAEKLEAALGRHSQLPKVVILRMRTVPAVDATGLHSLEVLLDKFERKGTHLLLSGVQPQPMKVLFKAGFVDKVGLDNFCANVDEALRRATQLLAGPGPVHATPPARSGVS
jgi:SulP family sulfate permease